MFSKVFLAGLVFFSASAFAVDDTFRMVKQDSQVTVYGKRPENCVSDGASVMFLVENKTRERLKLKLELLNMKVKNNLTLMLEPSGNTSVLALSPDADACGTELVDMTVNPVLPKPGSEPAKSPAMDPDGKHEETAKADRVL